MMLNIETTFLRILLALLLGGLIGWERESHERPAGFRTHILVIVGSTLLMIISINMAASYPGSNVDPGRIAAQVVSGIGFLGAGTIIREGLTVKGLTTAASLWATAAIGLACGGGYYYSAIITTVIVFVTLFFLSRIEFAFDSSTSKKRLTCRVLDEPGTLGEIGVLLGKEDINIKNIRLDRDVNPGELLIELDLIMPTTLEITLVNRKLLELTNIIEINWR
jgi:putative Mg2+ transporter-C (MgtC) family protein